MTPCAFCKSTDSISYIPKTKDYLTGIPFAIERCARCGLAFTTPQPDQLDKFYPQQYRRFGRVARRLLEFLYGRRARVWIRTLRTQGTALEIGSGAGWMLRALRRCGWKVIGSERCIQDSVAALARDGLPVFVGALDAIRSDSKFDLIILFQVLEHLRDPLRVLQQCERLLVPGGMLVVAVPNLDSWQAKVCGAWWSHLDVPRHLFHFTPSSLSQALEGVGLRVKAIDFHSLEHDPFGWIQSILNWIGFKRHQLTSILMGADTWKASGWAGICSAVISGLLVVPSVGASTLSWLARAGAIMQISAIKPFPPQ